MNYSDVNNILKSFAKDNIVFSNEFDFQFELAQAFQKLQNVKDVKMEVLSLENKWDSVKDYAKKKKRFPTKFKQYTDIIVETVNNKFYAFELKFKTPDRVCVYENTKFGNIVTMAQGAYDINAYAFWNDVMRLENINNRYFSKEIKIEKSYAIFLTNDKEYRYNDFSRSTIWKNYSMEDGKTCTTGMLTFKATNEESYKISKKIFSAIELKNQYNNLKWEDYSLSIPEYNDCLSKTIHPGFSYLILPVEPK